MAEKKHTRLTISQAIDAIASDFGQYGPQPDLFYKIAPFILKDNFKRSTSIKDQNAWVRQDKDHPFTKVDTSAFGFYLIHMLECSNPDSESMALICAHVFEASVWPFIAEGHKGVCIEDQMDGFSCKRCGNCCCGLEHVCTKEDLDLWKGLGRNDILAWVKKAPMTNGSAQYRIWIDPKTNNPMPSCPFLAPEKEKSTFTCTIHDVKPQVCREYPFTKKHAHKTGCLGFTQVHPG
ncbi:MAG: YkgJ family cysteine cluster protein [Desulfobacterales bacterium]|nr:YkgJ family cysteine cluster protein [Desulfobacterales bacterium]